MKQKTLLIMMFLLGMSISTSAADYETWTDGNGLVWKYTIIDDESVYIGYPGGTFNNVTSTISTDTSGDITVPTEIDGKKVTGMYPFAFGNCKNITSITFTQSIICGGACLFWRCSGLKTINGLSYIDVSQSKAALANIFSGCSSLTSISGVENWDVSNATDFTEFMENCSKVTDYSPLKDWKTSSAVTLKQAFNGCSNFNSDQLKYIKGWDVSKVKSLLQTFQYCNLTNLDDLANWEFKVLWEMDNTFAYNKELTKIEGIQNWDVSTVTTMGSTFNGCKSLADISPLASWATKTSKLKNMRSTFSGCNSLTTVEPLKDWNVSAVTDMSFTFFACNSLTTIEPLKNWNCSSVTYTVKTFEYCSSLTEVRDLPTTLTVVGDEMFGNCTNCIIFKIPNAVKTMGANVFVGTTKCKHVTLPSHLTSLGEYTTGGQTELTIPATVETLQANGYGSSLTSLYVLGTSLLDDWKDAESGPTIYVKKSVKENSYSDWSNVEYQIPITFSGKTRYVSRSRDFDMDFSNAGDDVHIWVPTGMDTSDPNVTNNVQMKEVTDKYIPSRLKAGEESYVGVDEYEGVIIEAPANTTIYYQIGEKDYYSGNQTTTYEGQNDNLLTGAYDQEYVTQKTEDGNSYNYGLKSNKFRLYSSDGWTSYNRAYLTLSSDAYDPTASSESSAKELTFTFNYADGTTKIVSAEQFAEQFGSDAIYNLQGQKVTDSYKGVIIKNGKKILNK